jgi:hypothetical protein
MVKETMAATLLWIAVCLLITEEIQVHRIWAAPMKCALVASLIELVRERAA